MHSVVRGTGTPKDRDEVNKRDTCEWDGWVCERDVMGAPSIFKLTRRAADLAKLLPIFDLSCPRETTRLKWKVPRFDCARWTPEVTKKRSVSRWACKNSNSFYTRSHASISLEFINLVSISRCSSSAHNRVHTRRVDSSTLVFYLFISPTSVYSFCL